MTEEFEEQTSNTSYQNEVEVVTISNEQINLENNLLNQLKHNLNIPFIDESMNINSYPYKVAIIGMNELGSATAFLLICKQIVTDIIIIDRKSQRLAAEFADLSACTTFVSGVNIQASNQVKACEDARVVILCDVNIDDTNNEENIQSNIATISKTISVCAPNAVVIVAIQPFEVTTRIYATNATIPSYRIIAPGTMIDSAHLRLLISEKLGISPASITGIVIGGHGRNNLPLWNSITVGGIHLLSENSTIGKSYDKENWHQIHDKINQRQEEIIKIKGTEVWSIAMATSELVDCVLRNKCEIHTITANIKGYYDVKTDAFLSIPAVISQNGVSQLITLQSTCNNKSHDDFSAIIQNMQTIIEQ